MPYISDRRDGLNHTAGNLKLPTPEDDPVEIVARKALIPCVEALVDDIDDCWGDGESVLV